MRPKTAVVRRSAQANGRMVMERAELLQRADDRVRAAVRRRQGVEAEEIAALLEARRLGVAEALGFGSFHGWCISS